ncbi:MAG: hypothetical protein HYV07_32125 [Deltaproteobacteria bacterium]|nr:hypothetical protein [Deltaproteobacteria bacterium]
MIGAALLFDRRGATPRAEAERLVERMLDWLPHRGEARWTESRPGVVVGARSSPSTPEDVGVRQPLRVPSGRLYVLDGRLDGRKDLLAREGLERGISDAELAATLFERHGSDRFAEVLGSYVLMVVDPVARTVVLLRDVMGGRSFMYSVDADRLVVASEEAAVLAAGVASEGDPVRIAQHLGAEEGNLGRTFFAKVRELPPGVVLEVDERRLRERRFVHVCPPAFEGRSHGDLADELRGLVDRSVRDRLRMREPGVTLSGGLDSSSVAVLAARALAPDRLKTISWAFEAHPTCDERRFIEPTVQAVEAEATFVLGDDSGPLSRFDTWPVDPSTPLMNPYMRLKQLVYDAAKSKGVHSLLTGIDGDSLYTGSELWLRDLLADGRFVQAALGLGAHVRRRGLSSLLEPSVRLAFGLVRRGGRRRAAAWLTPEALRLLEVDRDNPVERDARMVARPVQGRSLLIRAARGTPLGYAHGLRYGVEILCPFHDRRIVEFMLAVPAHQLYGTSGYKHVLRGAMRGLLPEVVRRAGRHGTLEALFRTGMKRAARHVSEILGQAGPELYELVDRAWLERTVDGGETELADYVAWQCVSFLLWVKATKAVQGAGVPQFC